ncbi:DUF5801 domain-containing protein [Bradyrhizobium sp. ISRA435]|nr:DUF5801 domain-containing protein [Bradyrhizobium sp. ISRA435]
MASGLVPFTIDVPGGQKSLTFALSISSQGVDSGLIDSRTGNHVFLFLENGQVVGREGGQSGLANFTISVDAAGNITLTDLRSMHEGTGEVGSDINEGTHLPAGLVTLTATVTDNNNNTASANVDVGTHVTFHDDGPTITASGNLNTLSVDESFIPVIGSGQAPAGSSTDTESFAAAFTVHAGADGQQSLTYGLSITNATTNLVDSVTNSTVLLKQVSATEVDGYVTIGGVDTTVFKLTVNGTGSVTMEIDRGVKEASADANTDSNEGTTLGANLVALTATVTDNDGDTASQKIDLGPQITVHDDGPTITASGNLNTLSVDESFIPVIGSGQAPAGSSTDTESFAAAFTVHAGADGQQSLTYGLSITNATTNLVDSVTNSTVLLKQVSATEVDGYVTIGGVDTTVFKLTVNGTGSVTMEIDRGVKEASADANTDSNEGTTLGANLVALTATVTDNDGDTASQKIDLGPQITVHDDGPTITASGNLNTLSVDESFIPVIGSGQAPAGSSTDTESFAAAFTVHAGADGQQSLTYGLSITNATTNLVDSVTNSTVLLKQVSATEVDGYVTIGGVDTTVFKLTVNGTGSVTMEIDRGVKEASADANTDSNEGTTLGANLVALTATVTDNDGDTASQKIDLGPQITVHDDGPTITASGNLNTLSVDESFIPVIGSGQAPAGSSTDTESFAAAFTVHAGADGQQSLTYGLSITNATTNLVDSVTNSTVLLKQVSATEVDGYVTIGGVDTTVFKLTVNGTGSVTMEIDRGVKEASADANTDSNEGTTLGANLVALTATVTDNDGDTASQKIDLGPQITVHDDGPTITASGNLNTLSVDESFIPVIGSGQAPAGSSTDTESFAAAFTVHAGADGQQSLTYGLSITNATTNLVDSVTNSTVLLKQVSATEVDGYVTIGGVDTTVFKLTVNGTGSVTMEIDRGVKEASADANTDSNEGTTLGANLVALTATVTDNDGDTASQKIDLGPQITVHDDGPTITASGNLNTLSVDESFIPVIGSGQAPAGSSTDTESFAAAFTVHAGADGQQSLTYGLSITNATTNLVDSVTNSTVLLKQVSATEVDGYVTIGGVDTTVFKLTVNGTGSVTMEIDRGVKEASADANTDSNEGTTLGANLVALTATVTDNDGDTASQKIDLGPQITVHDDGPTITASGNLNTLSVDESFIPVIGSGQAPAGSSTDTESFAAAFTVHAGADGQQSLTYGLSITNATTNLVDSVTNSTVLLKQVSATEVDGYVTIGGVDTTVFKLTVNGTGSVTMEIDRGVKEASADANTDSNEGTTLGANLVALTATVTDNDGDTASQKIDLGPQITVHDDGPTITASGNLNTLSVDESFIPVIGSGQAPAGSSTDTESFAAAFTVHAGADGQQSLTYGLSITNATTNLVDSVTNSTVLLKQVSATEVDGYVTIGGVDTTVFKLTVNGTGSVTMEIDRGVKEASADANTDSNEGTTLGANLVALTATVTDNDGDTASQKIDLGPQITVHDDGPTITASGNLNTLSVDESFIPVIGSGQAPAGSSTDTESFAAAFTVHAGADGQQSLTYGLSITNATTNLVDSVTNSTVLLKQVSATEVDGYVTIGGVDTTVFKLTVNGTGSVTMEIDRGVKEASADANTDSNEGTTLGANLVALTATVTDNDGDTASQKIDLGPQITVHDDGPTITASGNLNTLSVDESFIPVIGSGQAPAGSSTDTESFAAAFTVHAGADGQQSLTYGLSITNATTNLVDSVTNSTVLLKQVSATEVDGYVTIGGVDTTVFKLTVNGTGSVTMEIDRGVKEASADANTDSNEGTTLGANLVALTATVTDNDGDTASQKIDLGPQITVHDDGPTITAIQDAIMPNLSNTQVDGTWQPIFGADGPSLTNAIGVALTTGTINGITYTLTDAPDVGGHDLKQVVVDNGTSSYTFYEYTTYDPVTHSGEMFAFTDPSAVTPFFELNVNIDGTYTFHLDTNTLQSTTTFNVLTQINNGPADYITINGATVTYGSGNDPTSGFDVLIDGYSDTNTNPNANSGGDGNRISKDQNGMGLHNSNLETGETIFFKFGAQQSAFSLVVGKATTTSEHFLVTLYDQNHNFIASENVVLPDGSTLLVDAAHWGTGGTGGTGTTSGVFGNFYEVDIKNVATGGSEDSSIVITGFQFNEQVTVGNTALNFNLTTTDGDGDHFTSSDNLTVLLQGTHTGSGYQLTGANGAPEVLAASAGADTLIGGTGGGDTVDYSNTTGGVGVTINLSAETDTVAATVGQAATGDVIKGVENIIGTQYADILTAAPGGSILIGGGGNDTLNGGFGNDTLIGGAGDDALSGGGGNNVFVLQSSGGGHDNISDFSALGDQIVVDVASQNLTIGTSTAITAGQFNSAAATGADENAASAWNESNSANKFFFNNTTGELWYSANGTGSDKVDLAHLSTSLPAAANIHTM